MNNAAMTMIREIAETMHTVVKRKMTAKEMALTSHNLIGGNLARLQDGSEWIWDERFSQWSMWKAS